MRFLQGEVYIERRILQNSEILIRFIFYILNPFLDYVGIWVRSVTKYVSSGTTTEQKGMTPSLINKIESFEFVFVLHMMIQGSLMGYQMLYSRKIKTLLTPWPLLIP